MTGTPQSLPFHSTITPASTTNRANNNIAIILAMSLLVVLPILLPSAQAQTLTILHSFVGPEGASPMSAVIQDSAGNFYGTASFGGVTACSPGGSGTVYKMDRNGNTIALHAFNGGTDGCFPWSSLVRNAEGNLYGTTMINNVFKLAGSGEFTVLHTFTGAPDGDSPAGNLLRDSNNNLYGVTSLGGSSNLGSVFEISASGQERILYSFTGGADGAYPSALFRDQAGNFYGTTTYGGESICDAGFGCGTVFQLDANGKESVLYSFTGGPDGANPFGGVVRDDQGNLYGTTSSAGEHDCTELGCGRCNNRGCGTVFKLDSAGKLTTLHTFTGGADGSYPVAGLIRDARGNFYSTTVYGGDSRCHCGIVFTLDTNNNETILHTFVQNHDGAFPYGNLILDSAGNLYGTTDLGGAYNQGTIFKLTP